MIKKTEEERKEAKRISAIKYREKNKDKIKDKDKIYYENNKEQIKENVKKWSENNIEQKKETYRIWLETNKEKVNEINKNWKENNKEKVKEYKIKYIINNPEKIKENRKKDLIRNKTLNPHLLAWRNTLRNSINRLGQKKEGKTHDLLGYSALDLKNHITSLFTDGMSWDNYGQWHIDHIKMVCEFKSDTPMNIVNSLSNLRPLWATTREINGIIYEGNQNRPKNIIR